MKTSTRILGGIIVALFISVALVWCVIANEDRHGLLKVSFLDVGQGDAIFIDAPSGRQVLIDGGPGSSVLRRLGNVVPFFDHSIDVVIPTHPDADHVAGLVDVLRRYDVSYVVQSSVQGSTPVSDALERTIAASGVRMITASRGQVIDLGDGAYLEVLSPDRSLPYADTNTACVVTRLVYRNTAFMFSCDAPRAVERYLAGLDGMRLHADVLKAGHHGSRTSSDPLFVGYVNPTYVVYSRSCDNTYGFPHQETVQTFAKFGTPTFDTCIDGTVTFVSDGDEVRRE